MEINNPGNIFKRTFCILEQDEDFRPDGSDDGGSPTDDSDGGGSDASQDKDEDEVRVG